MTIEIRLPISSAPTNGTRIRLFHEEEAGASELCPTIGRYEDGRWIMNQLFIFSRAGRLLMSRVPTHWRPLEDGLAQPDAMESA